MYTFYDHYQIMTHIDFVILKGATLIELTKSAVRGLQNALKQ